MKCLLCNRATETQVCNHCVQRLDQLLEAIVEYYALLPAVLLPGSVLDDMPHGRRVDPPAPVRLEVLDALDERLVVDTEEYRGTLGILWSWARLIREERQLAAGDDPTVVTEIGFLRRHLPWVCEQPWVDEFEREIRLLHRSLRQATGETGPKPIGACPAESIHDGEVRTCGAMLYAPITGDVVRCRHCRAQWTREQWQLLGKVIREGETA